MNLPFLRVQTVTRRFASHVAVDHLSLDVEAGQIVVVVGPSGCGKTTLLRLIAGLDIPSSGEIWLDGRQLAAPGRNLVPPYQRRIGFVFQDLALWPHLTIREHLRFVLGSARVPKDEWPRRVQEVLSLVRIEPLIDRYPHQLSGGEQQRAALARSVITQPRLLLLDEPFSSLDHDLRVSLRTELLQLQCSLHMTTIYVTHHRDDAEAIADRILSMQAGRVETETTRAL